MKKFFALLSMLFVFISGYSIPLFPFFTDLAGDYSDGVPAEWAGLRIDCMYSRTAPSFYANLAEAEAFLKDVLPVSTEKIVRTESKLQDGTVVVKYVSALLDGGESILYLVEIPNKKFAVGYNETSKSQSAAPASAAKTAAPKELPAQQPAADQPSDPKKKWLKKIKKQILK